MNSTLRKATLSFTILCLCFACSRPHEANAPTADSLQTNEDKTTHTQATKHAAKSASKKNKAAPAPADSKTSNFSAEEIAKANTAKDANISENEKNVILLVNLARLDGTRFWDNYVTSEVSQCDKKYTTSLKADLKKVKKLPMLAFNEKLYASATYHAEDMGRKGMTGHTSSDGTGFGKRVGRYFPNGYIGENCSYGFEDPREIVLQLLIDEGVESLGHRKNILNPEFGNIGVSIRQHKRYGYNCVMDLAK